MAVIRDDPVTRHHLLDRAAEALRPLSEADEELLLRMREDLYDKMTAAEAAECEAMWRAFRAKHPAAS